MQARNPHHSLGSDHWRLHSLRAGQAAMKNMVSFAAIVPVTVAMCIVGHVTLTRGSPACVQSNQLLERAVDVERLAGSGTGDKASVASGRRGNIGQPLGACAYGNVLRSTETWCACCRKDLPCATASKWCMPCQSACHNVESQQLAFSPSQANLPKQQPKMFWNLRRPLPCDACHEQQGAFCAVRASNNHLLRCQWPRTMRAKRE